MLEEINETIMISEIFLCPVCENETLERFGKYLICWVCLKVFRKISDR